MIASPVGSTVTQRAVQGGGLGGGAGGLIAALLWGPRLVLAIGGHGAKTTQTNGEPVISSWSSSLSVKTTLGFEIGIHTEVHWLIQSEYHGIHNCHLQYFLLYKSLGCQLVAVWRPASRHGVSALISSLTTDTQILTVQTLRPPPAHTEDQSQATSGAGDQSEAGTGGHNTTLRIFPAPTLTK